MHNLTWSATSSAVGLDNTIEESLSWLTGGYAAISREKVKSYFGPKMILIKAHIERKKQAREAVSNLGFNLLTKLAESGDLAERIDEGNTLHLRLDLASLVCGRIQLMQDGGDGVVKGRFKLEVYPGQDPILIARELLSNAAKKAKKNN
ncbi:MAG: RNA-binding domain-containing protein [Candidatus Thalassarchaeaceae archaeon]|nr:RNA-binding domain-containing protein [Candidatus Thalassarchaeaceae archaeon]